MITFTCHTGTSSGLTAWPNCLLSVSICCLHWEPKSTQNCNGKHDDPEAILSGSMRLLRHAQQFGYRSAQPSEV
jgi:hypothetical protein